MELVLRGRYSAARTMVFCSKMLCLTECYCDKADIILSVVKPSVVGNGLLKYSNPVVYSIKSTCSVSRKLALL
jgi:hypothetical protein